MNREILWLEPVLKENMWGGYRLADEFHYAASGRRIGEGWVISAHPHGDCIVREGSYQGYTLSELYAEHRELFGNLATEEFPLLVKVIDAREKLSIQVHPDDAYVQAHEDSRIGKAECWYIMDCPENASLIVGHHAGSHEELEQMIYEKRYDELICEVSVKKGDFIRIDPGTVHSISAGFLILEIQQSSDITYRLYDYDRLSDGKPRQLHIQQSIDVIKVPDSPVESKISHADKLPQNQLNQLADCDFYKVWRLTVKDAFTVEQEHPFLIIDVLEGVGSIDGRTIKKGDHMLLPCGYGKAELTGELELMLSTVQHD